MTRREAKRLACALASDLLHADSVQDSWFMERIGHLDETDQRRVLDGVRDLVEELTRRAEGPP